ncbi:hypothetical protein Tco_0776784 [Tanacetum coccineum]
MYLTASRPDIMFTVCACSRFQVTPKYSYLSAVKRIFRYLKAKPKLGLWYPIVSSFDLESYSDSDYVGANLDRKSTIGGCQFLGGRLISWQCKKQTIVATSTTEAEYVAAASCCNPVYHSKTKHIAIRHHFIRDAYEKKLIQVLKIHTDDNVADLLTKAFDFWCKDLAEEKATNEALIRNFDDIKARIEADRPVTYIVHSLVGHTLISLLTTITLSTTMAVLDSCPKHNMVAYLEKSEGNAEFHEIIDFLTRKSFPFIMLSLVKFIWSHRLTNPLDLYLLLPFLNSIPESSGGNLEGLSSSDKFLSGKWVSDQAKKITTLKAQIKKAQEAKRNLDHLFDEIHEDTLDYMETENAQDIGMTRYIVGEEKENDEDVHSTEDILSANKEMLSTNKEQYDEKSKGTDDHTEEGSATQTTQIPTSTIFGDDETIAKGSSLHGKPKAIKFQKRGGKDRKVEERTRRKERCFLQNERLIKRMNEKGIDSSKNEMVKEEDKEEESTRKRKLGTRKKMKSKKRRFRQNTSKDDSEKKNDELRLCLTIALDEKKEVDYEIVDRKYLIKEWKTEYLGTKPQVDKAKHLEEINQNVVIRSNGQKRYFSTLMRVLSIFDRDDLNAIYQLVMDRYQDEIPEGFDRDWNIVSWKLHGSLGVHTLIIEEGLVIHMLVEKKYPLRKKVLLKMLELKLESEEDSTMALELIRFVKKLVAELEPEDSNGDEEDL